MHSTLLLSKNTEPLWMRELSEHLEPVLENARKIDGMRKGFRESYSTWLRVSEEAIETISGIRNEVIATNRKDNYFKVGGAAGGIVGSILGIVGVVATMPIAPFVLTGAVLAAGGTAVSLGSNTKRNAEIKSLCKKAVANLEKNKNQTVLFEAECQSYFEALDHFNSFFDTVSGNDVALSLFYEAADEEKFSFLDDLKLDRWSRDHVRTVLKEIIESDDTQLIPQMWSSEFVRGSANMLKSLAEKIHKMILELKRIIENDPYLTRLLCDKFRVFLKKNINRVKTVDLRKVVTSLTTSVVGITIVPVASASYANIRISLKEMSVASRFALVTLNALFVVVGIICMTKTLINLENGSQSEESKNITEVINDLKKIRKNIMKEMGKMFGW